jgi:hypothetical protein
MGKMEANLFLKQYTDEGAGFGCLQCSEGNVQLVLAGPRNYTGPHFTLDLVSIFQLKKNSKCLCWGEKAVATLDK